MSVDAILGPVALRATQRLPVAFDIMYAAVQNGVYEQASKHSHRKSCCDSLDLKYENSWKVAFNAFAYRNPPDVVEVQSRCTVLPLQPAALYGEYDVVTVIVVEVAVVVVVVAVTVVDVTVFVVVEVLVVVVDDVDVVDVVDDVVTVIVVVAVVVELIVSPNAHCPDMQ